MNIRHLLEQLSNPDDFRWGARSVDIRRQAGRAQVRGPPEVYSATLLPPYVSRMGYIRFHDANVKDNETVKEDPTKYQIKNTMKPAIWNNVAPQIQNLKQTTLQEVAQKVNHIHDDKILYLKTIYDAHRVVATSMLVEDDNGDCLMLSLYNYVGINEDPTDVFPVGTYLAVMAPYMKNAQDDKQQALFLRCDNPQCIRVFPFRQAWLEAKKGKKLLMDVNDDPSNLRLQGNEAFSQPNYESAARDYTRALACPNITTEDRTSCLANRAEVRIRQERWEAAEDDAQAVLQIDENHVKARFRLATALLHLNQLQRAYELIRTLAEETPKQKAFQELKLRVEVALQEQQGNFNFKLMRREAAVDAGGGAVPPFHANYCSPKIRHGVEIQKRNGFRYRGCVALDAMEPKTLVVASKAFAFVPTSKMPNTDFSINPYDESAHSGSQMALHNELIVLVHRRPQLLKALYSLSSGIDEQGRDASSFDKIDMDRIQCILNTNVFSADSENANLERAWKERRMHIANPDITEAQMAAKMQPIDSMTGSGLWLNESMFNHSCTPNCTPTQIGDHMFIWTNRHIQSNEELCVSYVSAGSTYKMREKIFSSWTNPNVGFICQCDWCHAVRSSPELQAADETVHAAYDTAAKMVTYQHVKMAVAAEQVLPSTARKRLMKVYDSLPFHIQHIASAKLWMMEGAWLTHLGKVQKALEAHKMVAEIKLAVGGCVDFERAKDLWRIVGASMACGLVDKAQALLTEIWIEFFEDATLSDRHVAFLELTEHYTLPWWCDSLDESRAMMMRRLVHATIDIASKREKSKRNNNSNSSNNHKSGKTK